MPRTARDLPTDSVSHVLDRGVERRRIFLTDEDYYFFLTQMKEVFDSSGVGILDFALMPNHFHIQPLISSVPVGIPMQKLLTRFALYFNRKYGRLGHLFQNRFRSFEVKDDAYLVQLPAYISKNPVKAGMVAKPEQWEWSGHNEIVSGKRRFLDLSRLEAVTGMPEEQWRESYLELMARDPQVSEKSGLEELVEYAALVGGISARDLIRGSRGTPFTKARRLVAKEARQRGFTQTEIAAALEITPASVAGLLRDPDASRKIRENVCPLS